MNREKLFILVVAAIAAGAVSLYIPPLYYLIGPAGCMILIPACVLAYGVGIAPKDAPEPEPDAHRELQL